MIKLFICTKKAMKQKVDSQIKQSPFVLWGGWIGAKKASKSDLAHTYNKDLVNVFYYQNFPKKTYDLHLYLRKIKTPKKTSGKRK